tara:strand:+ start:223 stop:411 length:189 start_codon:yes stop_codon:yes gene_type:complete
MRVEVMAVDWDSYAPKLPRVVQFKLMVKSYLTLFEALLSHHSKGSLCQSVESFNESVGRQFV